MTALASVSLSPQLLRLRVAFRRPDVTAEVVGPMLHESISAIMQNARLFDGIWEGLCSLALAGRPAEAHELRDSFIAGFADTKSNRLSARWQTAEDLEDLAAESIEIPAEKVEAIRQKYGFPQAWYDEDGKPF